MPSSSGAVLVTGCSSGIGRATAVHLAREGYTVFATVRREADAGELRALGLSTLLPVCPLDLSRAEQIPPVLDFVAGEISRRGIRGLHALVNNAGGSAVAPVELLSLDKFRTELMTRVLGSVGMVQAFLPLIREARGRIIWIVTPAIMPTPYVTSIHACDFAVNCVARTLEIELKPWDIPNIMVRCGGIRTRAAQRTSADKEDGLAQAPPERAALYRETLRHWGEDMADFDKKRSEPEKVAELISRALSARSPRRRYSVGHMSRAAAFLESLPPPLTDRILAFRFRQPRAGTGG